MSSGGALTIDCARKAILSPLKVRTITRDTVPGTDCEVDNSRLAKQVVKLERENPGPKIKTHIRVECGGNPIVLTDPNGNNQKSVEWNRNLEVGVQTKECEFYFCKDSKSASGSEQLYIELWHSGSKEIAQDADRILCFVDSA